MKIFAAQLAAQSYGRISPASTAALADPARCRRTGAEREDQHGDGAFSDRGDALF